MSLKTLLVAFTSIFDPNSFARTKTPTVDVTITKSDVKKMKVGKNDVIVAYLDINEEANPKANLEYLKAAAQALEGTFPKNNVLVVNKSQMVLQKMTKKGKPL